MTTSYRPAPELLEAAYSIANTLNIQFVSRMDGKRKQSLNQLRTKYHCDDVLVVEADSLRLEKKEEPALFFHPSMGLIRMKRLRDGGYDPLIAISQIQAGDRVLDCTCGLGSDSLVLSFAAGEAGRVDACESSPVIALIVADGLARYTEAEPDMIEAMRRIQVHPVNHLTFMQNQPDRSYDIVYFDPMFEQPITESESLRPLRHQADYTAFSTEALNEARRIARKAVVIKDHFRSAVFEQYGFETPVHNGAETKYGVLR